MDVGILVDDFLDARDLRALFSDEECEGGSGFGVRGELTGELGLAGGFPTGRDCAGVVGHRGEVC